MMCFATSKFASRYAWSIALLTITAILTPILCAQANESQGSAKITAVSPISPKAWQRIVIKGTHLGTNPPFNGCSGFIRITDVMNNRVLPSSNFAGVCDGPILITSWTDTEIVIEGFPQFQRGQDAFAAGDMLKIEVRSPQQNSTQMAWLSLRVTPEGVQPPAPSTPAPVPAEPVRPASANTESTGPGALFKDDFASDHSLNDSLWTTSGETLNARMLKADTHFVPVRLAFASRGLSLGGVNGRYQSTGIQSRQRFSAPFTLEATVMGTMSNGNPFALYLVGGDGSQYLAVNGNLDSQGGSIWFGHSGSGSNSGNEKGAALMRGASVGTWYVIRFVIDGRGIGAVCIEDRQGGLLAKQDQLDVGTGPFFVVLAQWAGWPRTQGPNEAVWSSVKLIPGPGKTSTASSSPSTASVVQATIREGATSLELPPGQMYLYGMATGGGAATSEFATGPYAKVLNIAGKLSAALAYGPNSQNSYSTQTAYHDIGGASVAGSWKNLVAYYGSNHQTGAHDASVSFQTNEDSLVVVLGLASSQQFVSVEGLPNLQVDASRTGGGIVIAHANVGPGSYNVIERSKVLAAGQDPAHMADLVGVFVFSGKRENEVSATAAEQSPAARVSGASKGNIRSVDFQNFNYTTNCLSENDPAQGAHVSNGQANTQDGQFWADKPVYGDLKGDGHEQAAVALGCHPAEVSPNVNFSEVFIFEMSNGEPRVLAKLPPSAWKERRVTGLKISGQQLAVDFLETGMGSNACPEWVVTAKLHWNGSRFVNAGESRRKNSCAR